jgi:hypothetical protein
MISVFRIYLGQAWLTSGRAPDLIAMFDAEPELLYSVCHVPIADAADPALSLEDRRAVARIAMTQAHVVVVPADAPAAGDGWTEAEIQVARTGLRQRLPIVAVRHLAGGADGLAVRAADQVQPWISADIACAIQQAVEAAAVDRRKLLVARERQAAASEGQTAEPEDSAARPLPAAEIADAYAAFRQSRGLPA